MFLLSVLTGPRPTSTCSGSATLPADVGVEMTDGGKRGQRRTLLYRPGLISGERGANPAMNRMSLPSLHRFPSSLSVSQNIPTMKFTLSRFRSNRDFERYARE